MRDPKLSHILVSYNGKLPFLYRINMFNGRWLNCDGHFIAINYHINYLINNKL